MQKIVPHLWFDQEAKAAAEFYASLFPNSGVTNVTTIRNTPSGDCDVVSFSLWGCSFMAISAGPLYKLNPSVSLMVNFDPSRDADAKTRIDEVWAKLSEGGKALMPIGAYPFSERYGWVQDRYGLSWQLILTKPGGGERPPILPFLMFVGGVSGKAEEASDFYLSVFRDAERGTVVRFPAGAEPEKEGTVMFTDFKLEGQWFAAMDSARGHDFAFNEAVSFIVNCGSQEEVDYYWRKLSAAPEAERCGWLKDRFGVSWQIIPTALGKLMGDPDRAKAGRVMQAMLKMGKIDIAALEQAYHEA